MLKIGKVVPVPNEGDSKDMNNFRTITIPNPLSKLFEKVISGRLNTFITYQNVISSQHYNSLQ